MPQWWQTVQVCARAPGEWWASWREFWRERTTPPEYRFGDAPTADEMASEATELRQNLDAAYLRIGQLAQDLEDARLQVADLLGWDADGALTAEQMRRLAQLMADCADVSFLAAMVLQQGWVGKAERPLRNRLEQKLGRLRASVEAMVEARDLRNREIAAWRDRRLQESRGERAAERAGARGEANGR